VNGSTGYVQELVYESTEDGEVPADEPSSIIVKLDDGRAYEVKRTTTAFQVAANLYVTRSQFPIYPCYAVTIHKGQSITRDNIMLSLTDAHDASMGYASEADSAA
jgi:ATP-dependent exoDNAse (exonuclease V) alpha subunit